MCGQMPSPITVVVDCLLDAASRSRDYRERLRSSEANTRSSLIDPLLLVLGWDLTLPDHVEVERCEKFNNQPVFADYLLLDSNGENVAVIEAKKLDSDINNYDQITQYRGAFKCDKLFLTDGKRWKYFSRFDAMNVEPESEWSIDGEDVVETAMHFIRLLDIRNYREVTNRADVAEFSRSFDEQIGEVEAKVARIESSITSWRTATVNTNEPATMISRQSEPNAKPEGWLTIQELLETTVTHKSPQQIQLPNGTKQPVSTWSGMLIAFARYALDKGLRPPVKSPTSKKYDLIGRSPLPVQLTQAQHEVLGETWHIYANLSATDCVRNAVAVLGDEKDSAFVSLRV